MKKPVRIHVADQNDFIELKQRAQRCRNCPLWEHATQTVFGSGPSDATIMIVGEQPGDQEDLHGEPFIGPAGKMIDRALIDAGLERDKLYITNAVKHFKYEMNGTRRMHETPAQHEIEACHGWLQEEIELIKPRAIVALGDTASHALLTRTVSVIEDRGHWFTTAHGYRVLLTVHPSSLLQTPSEDRDQAYRLFVEDLRHLVSDLR